MRASQNYLMVERLGIVSDCILSGCYPSSSMLAKRVETILGTKPSIPTIYRDIEFLRDRQGLYIVWDASRKGYVIRTKNKEA
jgi:hypothetical protein